MSRKKELLDTVASAIDLAKGISEQTIEVRSALVHLTRSLSSVAQIAEDTEIELTPEPVKVQAVLPEKKSATPSKKSKKK